MECNFLHTLRPYTHFHRHIPSQVITSGLKWAANNIFKSSPDKKPVAEKEEVQRRIINEQPTFEHKNFDAPIKDVITQFLQKKIDDRLGCK